MLYESKPGTFSAQWIQITLQFDGKVGNQLPTMPADAKQRLADGCQWNQWKPM
jgi:hypothetical protein